MLPVQFCEIISLYWNTREFLVCPELILFNSNLLEKLKGAMKFYKNDEFLQKIRKIDNIISFVNVAFILKPPTDNQSLFCLINLSLGYRVIKARNARDRLRQGVTEHIVIHVMAEDINLQNAQLWTFRGSWRCSQRHSALLWRRLLHLF